MSNLLKIVIGTRRFLPGFFHIDIDPRPLIDSKGGRHPVDLVCDARKINLPDQCAELVYAQEVLEHFPWAEYQAVLREWCRLVGVGGQIKIEVPDALAAFQQALGTDTLEMDRAIQQIIFGGQANQYDFHYVGLTPRMLTEDLEDNGFKIVSLFRGYEVGYLQVIGERVR